VNETFCHQGTLGIPEEIDSSTGIHCDSSCDFWIYRALWMHKRRQLILTSEVSMVKERFRKTVTSKMRHKSCLCVPEQEAGEVPVVLTGRASRAKLWRECAGFGRSAIILG
jgi:hypothetical protein